MATTAAFEEAYKKLNKEQKKAVDTVEGPVMVIAGPGTGKTFILTLRVANILKVTQAKPTNILALTFTDSAARTIKERLRTLMGEETARDVFVSTFHSFAEHILKAYAEHFPAWDGKRLMGDVETVLLWREVFDETELTELRTPKSPYHYLKDVSSLYQNLVRERVSTDAYRAWVKDEEKSIRADDSLLYLKDGKYGKKGEMKPEGFTKLERLEKANEAMRLFAAYEAKKSAGGLYDYADVLQGVVAALEKDESLRAALQEQYQYVLADEHQDANAYQHALLDAFAYDDHPNIFVVGDEKQAIFRFQGADTTHFREFLERYPRTEVITLASSFRALQGLLDAAHKTASTHMPLSTGKHAALAATRKGEASVSLLLATDQLAERSGVTALVLKALAEGTKPEEIAVIAATNASVDLMAAHLRGAGIPTLRAGAVSLDSRPFMRAIFALMRAVANPLDAASLRGALLAPWWDVSLKRRAEFLQTTWDSDFGESLTNAFPHIAAVLEKLQKAALDEGPLAVFSRLLTESGARAYALSHAEHLEDVSYLRMLFEHFEELLVRDRGATFASALMELGKAEEHGLEWVKSAELTAPGQVTVITTHKVKGMEFERVFIVGLSESEWEKAGRAGKLPSPIDSAKTLDDAARQFYVALTRAKDSVVLSYAAESVSGRERKASALIPGGLTRIEPEAEALPKLHYDVAAPELVRALTRNYLLKDGLYPSALQDYLESPAKFFATRVLRMREPEQPAMTIGNAVHAGIAAYLEAKSVEKAHAALESALKHSMLPRNTAYEAAAKDARQRLVSYMDHSGTLGEAIGIEKKYSVKRKVGSEEITLSGKIDAVFKGADGVSLVDFKTSSSIKPKDPKILLQLGFYDLILRGNGETPAGACIVQVLPDEVKEYKVPITGEVREELLTTIDTAVSEMLSGKWREGEPSEYDALLVLFRDS